MILVDTSIWIDHLNQAHSELVRLLNNGIVCTHPFIIGELACGNIINRTEIITLLNALPCLDTALESEVLNLLESHQLYGSGLGYIDVHLIAAALINNVKIWTRDKNLNSITRKLNISK